MLSIHSDHAAIIAAHVSIFHTHIHKHTYIEKEDTFWNEHLNVPLPHALTDKMKRNQTFESKLGMK